AFQALLLVRKWKSCSVKSKAAECVIELNRGRIGRYKYGGGRKGKKEGGKIGGGKEEEEERKKREGKRDDKRSSRRIEV
ncbi:hypothetical protein, partial [Piscirickettsia salmonis]|uniref:hypothetical protein n=1 Tax=Piscirickettsia salmonis TaxID=1238 RepID=UPI00050A1465